MASRVGVPGWVTGVLSAALGALAFGAALCLWFPAVLTTAALRDVYPMEIVRTAIKVALGVAFALGVSIVLLERRQALGLAGAGLALLATFMGGSEVAVATPVARSSHVGLDWLLLDLFLLSPIFVPIELLRGASAPADLPERVAHRPVALRGEPSSAGRWRPSCRPRSRPSPTPCSSWRCWGEPDDGLARRLAPAPGGHRGDPRALLRAALRAGLRPGATWWSRWT